jgi:hypothetical protein
MQLPFGSTEKGNMPIRATGGAIWLLGVRRPRGTQLSEELDTTDFAHLFHSLGCGNVRRMRCRLMSHLMVEVPVMVEVRDM